MVLDYFGLGLALQASSPAKPKQAIPLLIGMCSFFSGFPKPPLPEVLLLFIFTPPFVGPDFPGLNGVLTTFPHRFNGFISHRIRHATINCAIKLLWSVEQRLKCRFYPL